MIVYYRLAGISSTNPSPIFAEDKFKLNELCLKSFRKAFENPKVVVLADFCGPEYDELLKPYEVYHTEIGINETCLLQYDMASKQDDDIFFLECDYLWAGQGQALIDGMNQLGLVSPYDHLNFYLDRAIHSNQVMIELVGDTHWRTTEQNTMTFAIKNEIFKKNIEIFKHYGYLDSDLWHDILAKGQPLWTPIPSLATHMAKDWLAPSIDWKKLYEKS